MKILVGFFKFFAIITSILLVCLITFTSISYAIQKEVTKDKIKNYLFNITYTEDSISNLVNTYEIKQNLGYTDYLAEIVIDKAFETSGFKNDMSDYLTDIIYENKEKSDIKEVEKIVDKNIMVLDNKNRITKETKTLMITTINDYIDNVINDNISKNERTTVLLNIINYFLNVNVKLMIGFIALGCLLLIIFTISFIRPIKNVGISTLISGIILISTRIIEGPLMNIFIKGETTLLEASKTLVKDLFNKWFEIGIVLFIVGLILIIAYKVLMYIFDARERKRIEEEKRQKELEKKKQKELNEIKKDDNKYKKELKKESKNKPKQTKRKKRKNNNKQKKSKKK